MAFVDGINVSRRDATFGIYRTGTGHLIPSHHRHRQQVYSLQKSSKRSLLPTRHSDVISTDGQF
jgi:hypothetical protein